MFSSRTLADRNNDPAPAAFENGGERISAEAFNEPYSSIRLYSNWEPRPEFQHGVLPENPILALFRTCPEDKAEDWVWGIDNGHNDPATPAQIVHARRVLTLLSKSGANQ